jgi:hypothetical protein
MKRALLLSTLAIALAPACLGNEAHGSDASPDAGAVCIDDEVSFEVTGEISYPAYTSGQILVQVCEALSSWCGEKPDEVYGQTPGDCLNEQTLDAPGAISIDATTSWAASSPDSGWKPGIDILVSVLEIPGDFSSCTAGTLVGCSAPDCQGLEITLKKGLCPTRE